MAVGNGFLLSILLRSLLNGPSEAYKRYERSDLIFSQFNMSMVHVAFFESVVINPTMVHKQFDNDSVDFYFS